MPYHLLGHAAHHAGSGEDLRSLQVHINLGAAAVVVAVVRGRRGLVHGVRRACHVCLHRHPPVTATSRAMAPLGGGREVTFARAHHGVEEAPPLGSGQCARDALQRPALRVEHAGELVLGHQQAHVRCRVAAAALLGRLVLVLVPAVFVAAGVARVLVRREHVADLAERAVAYRLDAHVVRVRLDPAAERAEQPADAQRLLLELLLGAVRRGERQVRGQARGHRGLRALAVGRRALAEPRQQHARRAVVHEARNIRETRAQRVAAARPVQGARRLCPATGGGGGGGGGGGPVVVVLGDDLAHVAFDAHGDAHEEEEHARVGRLVRFLEHPRAGRGVGARVGDNQRAGIPEHAQQRREHGRRAHAQLVAQQTVRRAERVAEVPLRRGVLHRAQTGRRRGPLARLEERRLQQPLQAAVDKHVDAVGGEEAQQQRYAHVGFGQRTEQRL